MARNKAVKLRADNKKQKDILHSLAISQANLDKANSVANASNVMLITLVKLKFTNKVIKFYFALKD